MTKFQLSGLQLNILETALGLLGGFGSYLTTHLANFPVSDQMLVSIIGLAIGYFVADVLAELKGQSVTAATVISQVQQVYTPAIQSQLQAKIKATVTDPSQQAIALAVLQEVDLALASYTPPSPLSQAVAASKPATP